MGLQQLVHRLQHVAQDTKKGSIARAQEGINSTGNITDMSYSISYILFHVFNRTFYMLNIQYYMLNNDRCRLLILLATLV